MKSRRQERLKKPNRKSTEIDAGLEIARLHMPPGGWYEDELADICGCTQQSISKQFHIACEKIRKLKPHALEELMEQARDLGHRTKEQNL